MWSTCCLAYTILSLPCWVLPPPPVCPPLRSPNTASFAPSQCHWQEMTSHTENESTPSDNKPLHLGSKVSRVTRESVRVFETCMRVDSDQLSVADSLSDSRVCANDFVVFQACVTVHACCDDSLHRLETVLPGIGL